MTLKQKLINALPPFLDQKVLLNPKQNTDDIVKEILLTHNEYADDYSIIYPYFDTGSLYSTCSGLWNFLKTNLVYNAESVKDQSVKSPAAILHPGEKIDCKHYALFAGGILDAIKRNEGDTWSWCYRFASDESPNNVGHVFVVAKDGNREYWIDPCLYNFDQKKQYILIIDKEPMPLYKISGVGAQQPQAAPDPKTVIVAKTQAWTSFLTIINLDLFSLKTLMLRYPAETNKVMAFLAAEGFDTNQLYNFLNARP